MNNPGVRGHRGRLPAWSVRLLAAAIVAPWIAAAARGDVVDGTLFFTKRVEQLTGWSGRGRVVGQDSAFTLPNATGPGATFWFSDTWADCRLIPTSMASTTDVDASDGISLVYHQDEWGRALPPLPKNPATGEASVWLQAPFRRGEGVCIFYYMVPPLWPDHPPEDELGSGIACMADGSPPFVRLGANVLPSYPHLLGPKNILPIGGEWLILFVNETVDGAPRTFLARSLASSVDDFSSYTYWDGGAWSGDPGDRVPVFSNLSAPSIAWNDHLGAWVAIGSIVLSPDGLLSRIGLATADSYTGPWSEPVPLYGETGGGLWGSVYNAFHTSAFDQEQGRRMFTTVTHWQRYNVDLFETSVGHAESVFCLAKSADDADQLVGEAAASTSGPSLLLSPGSRSVIGLRLTGDSWVRGAEGIESPLARPEVAASALVLPLAAPPAESFAATLLVRVGAPNAPSESERDLYGMPSVSEIVVDVPVTAGANVIRIGDEAAAIFSAVIQASEWSPGYDNVVPITLSRLDEYPLDLQLASKEGGLGGEAWLCHGECPAAPSALGAECRPRREYVKADCSKKKPQRSSCGLGGEIVLMLPVLVLLRRRRKPLPRAR